MLLAGLLGLAAVGGAAYAMSDVFTADGTAEDDAPDDTDIDDIPEGEFLDVGENIDDPEPEEDSENPVASTGTIIGEHMGDLVIAGTEGVDEITGQDGNDQING